MLRAAAYFTAALLKSGIPVGLRANAEDAGTGREAVLPARGGANQLASLMQLLSRMEPDRVTRPMEEVLEQTLRQTRSTPELILISFSAPDALQERTRELRANGMKWVIFQEKESRMRFLERAGLCICEVD